MKVKCISTKGIPDGYLSIGKVYIVVGLHFRKGLNEDIMVLLSDEYDNIYWYDVSLFEITDNKLPDNWTFNVISENWYVISYKEYCTMEYNNDLLDWGHDAFAIFKMRYKELENWYRDREIDEFFTDAEKYGITDSEKKTMLEYYKSLPDSTQWEQDKELLMLNSSR